MSSSPTDFRKEDISVIDPIIPSSSPSRLIQLARKFNNFYLESLKKNDFKPLVCQGHQIGLVAKNVELELSTFPQVFDIHSNRIEICPDLTDYQDITNQIEDVLTNLRCQDKFSTLKGWRNERYEIRPRFGSPALFAMERAATPLFGLLQYGVDLNGYVKDQNGNISLWISKRSQTKQTWPGCFDNFVAGGLSVGLGVKETAIKESQEEANLPQNIAENLEAAGSIRLVSYAEMDVVLMGIVLPILFCYYGYWWLLVNSYRRQISSATVSPFKEQEVKIRQDDIYHIEERESQVESYNNQGNENPYRVPSHRLQNLPLRLHTPLSTPSHLHSPLSYPLTPLPTYTSGYVSPLQEEELILRREDKSESPRDSCNTIVVELNS